LSRGHGLRAARAIPHLFLDKKNGLIADEVQQTGTVDHTPVYPREMSAGARTVGDRDHPRPQPSVRRSDAVARRYRHDEATVVETAKPLGIAVHDHIIIGRQGHASLRGLGLM
jgi:DNA repair protein RadC